jgi:hypothetical protein
MDETMPLRVNQNITNIIPPTKLIMVSPPDKFSKNVLKQNFMQTSNLQNKE